MTSTETVTREDDEMMGAATAPDAGAEEPSPGALSQLIQEVIDHGTTYQRLAEKAIDPVSGTAVSKQYLQKVARTPPSSAPSVVQLRAIAAALKVSERRVKAAAASQWLDLDYEASTLAGYDSEVRLIVGHLAGKSPAELRRWRAMIEADERARRDEE
ncbi:hypothetical protein [Streptomyces diastaticus]|uniref:hypothetical protein n=1 Tax=Streptomyces diastaticus TaxID=1956 RepID=UPI0035DC3828